ncbi:hypothetical protein EG348_18875 [Chryseobacterium sp. G0201]|nr:hypothetical protein EG348_18875 [Chryseobacterium sp. G0201]
MNQTIQLTIKKERIIFININKIQYNTIQYNTIPHAYHKILISKLNLELKKIKTLIEVIKSQYQNLIYLSIHN